MLSLLMIVRSLGFPLVTVNVSVFVFTAVTFRISLRILMKLFAVNSAPLVLGTVNVVDAPAAVFAKVVPVDFRAVTVVTGVIAALFIAMILRENVMIILSFWLIGVPVLKVTRKSKGVNFSLGSSKVATWDADNVEYAGVLRGALVKLVTS